jgi:hypothetical protein
MECDVELKSDVEVVGSRYHVSRFGVWYGPVHISHALHSPI